MSEKTSYTTKDTVSLVILCAGPGKRLRPLTLLVPKPLIPIGGVPNIVKLTRCLLSKLNGLIGEIIVVLGYAAAPYFDPLRTVLKRAFEGVETSVVFDSKLRGTAGHLKTILHLLHSEYILLVNGDLVIDEVSGNSISNCLREVLSKRDADIVIFCIQRPIRFGLVKYTSERVFESWLEKPMVDTVAGIYIIRRDVIDKILSRTDENIDMNIFVRIAHSEGFKVKVAQISGLVEDIGVVEDYLRVVTMLSEDYLR